MSNVPLFPDFKSTKITMITATADFTKKNEFLVLPAIFSFLPVHPVDLTVKIPKGKFRYPKEWNSPGRIISMAYGNARRGYLKPGRNRVFENCISLDIGTSSRIVNIMLFSSMKISGAPSYAAVKEAAESLVSLIKETQERIRRGIYSESEEENEALKKLTSSVSFDGNLYGGELEVAHYQVRLINRIFDLGRKINRKSFSEVYNLPPFSCFYNNILPQRKMVIYHYYHQGDTGEEGSYSFSLSNTGTVTVSGCSLENMEVLYNTFILRFIENYDYLTIQSRRTLRIKMPKMKDEKVRMSVKEWLKEREKEFQFTSTLIDHELPLFTEPFRSHSTKVYPYSPLFLTSSDDSENDEVESDDSNESENED